MRCKIVALGVSLCLMGLISDAGAATLITFDDLSASGGTPISNGYMGLDWDNFGALNTQTMVISGYPNGYANGVVSLNNVAFNYNSNPANFSDSSTPFALNSLYLTAAWNDGLSVEIDGYHDGILLDTTTLTLDTSGPTLFTLDWSGLDEVLFTASGGTPNANFPGTGFGGTWFALDNLQVTFDAPVATPLPPTLPLFASGLFVLGLLGSSWKRKGADLAF